MIIVLKPKITKRQETAVLREIKKLGYEPHVMRGVARVVIGAIGDERDKPSLEALTTWAQVESVTPVQKKFNSLSGATCHWREKIPRDGRTVLCRE